MEKKLAAAAARLRAKGDTVSTELRAQAFEDARKGALEAMSRNIPSRWVGRVLASWQSGERDVQAGDQLPVILARFEAAVAQPAIEQLHRVIKIRVYRTATHDGTNFAYMIQAHLKQPRRFAK